MKTKEANIVITKAEDGGEYIIDAIPELEEELSDRDLILVLTADYTEANTKIEILRRMMDREKKRRGNYISISDIEVILGREMEVNLFENSADTP